MEEYRRRSFISTTRTHSCACDCDRVSSLWQVRSCIKLLPPSEWQLFRLPHFSPVRLLCQHDGEAHSGQVELETAMCCSGLAPACSTIICSLIYWSSGNWQSPSLCCQATKTVPASGGEQANQVTQRTGFTWLASKLERGLSGSTQDHGCWTLHESWWELRKSKTSHFGGLSGALAGEWE